MEIADVFVVNKADGPDADTFVNLRLMLAPAFHKTTARSGHCKNSGPAKGYFKLFEKIIRHQQYVQSTDRKYWLLAEKAYYLIQQHRMRDINKAVLKAAGEIRRYKPVSIY